MIIGVDIDNCILSTTEAVLEQHYVDTGEKLTLDNIKSYYIENHVSEEYKYDFHLIFLKKEMWKRAKVIPNCVEVIKRLHNQGHKIYFVTSTEAKNVAKKESFLKRTFPFLDIRKCLITTHCKQMIGVDILVDDCIDNTVGADYYSILMDYPWNSTAIFDEAEYDNIYRVFDWLQVEPMIEYIQTLKSSNENKVITSENFAKNPKVIHSNSIPLLLDNEQIGVVRQIENGVMSGEISLGNLSVEMLQLSDNKYEVKTIRIKH